MLPVTWVKGLTNKKCLKCVKKEGRQDSVAVRCFGFILTQSSTLSLLNVSSPVLTVFRATVLNEKKWLK